MGKKKRYRLRTAKFGRKYAAKYGLGENTETQEETLFEETPAPIIMAAPEPAKPVVEAPVIVAAPEPVVEASAIVAAPEPTVETSDPIVEAIETIAPPKKKKATRKKPTTTPRKATRKRASRAKTAS